MKKVLGSQAGQTIVEFALVLPLLVLFLIGIIEFSIIFYDKAVITDASREGARQGSVFRSNPSTGAYAPLDNTQIGAAVTSYATGRLASFGASTPPGTTTHWSPPPSPAAVPPYTFVWSTTQSGNAASGGFIKVTVTYNYTYLALPRILGWGNQMVITAETIMRME